jgi:hypothetical protein
MLSPMYDAGKHYYIDKLAHLKISEFVIPVQWLEDTDRNVFVDAYAVVLDEHVQVSLFWTAFFHIELCSSVHGHYY